MPEINYDFNTLMPGDEPVIRKLGVVADGGEMTPFVRRGRLLRIDTMTSDHSDTFSHAYAVITDCETGEQTPPFADGFHFFSAYCEGDTVYAFCTNSMLNGDWGGDTVLLFHSDDMQSWQSKVLFTIPGLRIFNTSVCKGPDGYMMAYEAGCSELSTPEQREAVGVPFTECFASSRDLLNWTLLPFDHCQTRERYCACPVLRFFNGYYYMICLEALPAVRYEPYIYRTKDFYTWEIGLHNPVLWVSREDRVAKPGVKLSPRVQKQIDDRYMNINNCDVDLCEFEGKTRIFYLTGNQLGMGVMCEAEYDGPLGEFLEAFFR